MTTQDQIEIVLRLLGALAAGGMIGLERSYHGRPAGFRTHTLVALASALLMLVTVYEAVWFQTAARVTVDPTRMAQGIMTGIGFLGAGVIVKEGLTVRGLTTAGSIWITSAIGILAGIGFWFPAAVGIVFTLGTLSVFRWIEMRLPSNNYSSFSVRFARAAALPEDDLRALIGRLHFSISSFNYRMLGEGTQLEFRMVLRTLDAHNVRALSEALNAMPAVLEYRISPASD
jgi:putative Mg2+ transporter-C (MgtC) family protein